MRARLLRRSQGQTPAEVGHGDIRRDGRFLRLRQRHLRPGPRPHLRPQEQGLRPLVATALGTTKPTLVACSGATTADIIGGQDRALSRKTTHASISIGGNDVGFRDVIRSCVFGSESTCKTAVDSTNTAISSQLPAKLSATYAAIKARAPKATVVVVGYPRVFNTGDVSCSQANGISGTEAGWLNQVSDNLDSVIEAAASTAEFDYVDPNTTFAGHDVCASDPYVNGIGSLFGDSRSVYHPTVDGHAAGFEPLVSAALRG